MSEMSVLDWLRRTRALVVLGRRYDAHPIRLKHTDFKNMGEIRSYLRAEQLRRKTLALVKHDRIIDGNPRRISKRKPFTIRRVWQRTA